MALTRIALESHPLNEGHVYPEAGAYEEMTGVASFALDPRHPLNAVITDLELAPTQADGRVHFGADVSILRPADPAKRKSKPTAG